MSTYIYPEQMQMAEGDLAPPLTITIGDNAADADFSIVDPADVTIYMERGDVQTNLGSPLSVVPASDNKSAVVKRPWQDGETDGVGRAWVSVVVDWGDGVPQTFPEDAPLRLDFTPAAGTV